MRWVVETMTAIEEAALAVRGRAREHLAGGDGHNGFRQGATRLPSP